MTIASSNNEQTTLTNQIKQPTSNNAAATTTWPIINQLNHSYNEETEDEASSLDDSEHAYLDCPQDDDNDYICSDMEESVICGCGKVLATGWDCSQCRSNCSSCHRALGPNEICNRCVSVKRNTTTAN